MVKETQRLTKEQMEDFKKFQKRLNEDPQLKEGFRQLMGGASYRRAVKMKNFGDKLSNISEGIDDIFFLSSTPAGRQQLRMKKLQKEQLEALRELKTSQHDIEGYEDEFITDNAEDELTAEEQAELDAIQKEYEAEEELKAAEDADDTDATKDTEMLSFEDRQRAAKMTAQLIAGIIIILFGIIVFVAVMGSIK